MDIGIDGKDNSWPVTVSANTNAIFSSWYVNEGSSWEAVAVESQDNGNSFPAPIVFGSLFARI